MLGVEVPLLTDWEGEVIRAFGVEREVSGMTGVPMRSAFLIANGETVVASWLLGGELPDVDAVIALVQGS
jgi:peroxiredoxin